MIPDQDIIENRVHAMRDLPWSIPVLVIMQFTDEDLDLLDAAYETGEYWTVLNGIVTRIERSV